MDDIRAKNIADVYLDTIRQAKRIGVSQEHIPFVAVCLTVDEFAAGRERRNMLSPRLKRKMEKLFAEETL